jgi:membrane-bound lytic murein transglycosylase D
MGISCARRLQTVAALCTVRQSESGRLMFRSLLFVTLLFFGWSPVFTPVALAQQGAESDGAEGDNESAEADSAGADSADDESDEDSTDAEDESDTLAAEEGRADFKDVESLNTLEANSLRPVVFGVDGGWPGSLLAPFSGTWTAVIQDAGKVPELQQGRVPIGSELLSIPSVRKRFETTSMLGLRVHDQPSVRAYLDFFDGRGKPTLAKWISRMGRFEPLIRETLRAEGLPEDLIFVAMIESGFSPRATSPASAVGVWQFIPTTGSEMGLDINRYVDERRDPVKATKAAAAYLKRLYKRFGSWPLALASYNGGPGLMSKNIRRFNSNDFWHIQRHGGLYDESRRYVPKIIAAGLVTKNADVFGLASVEKVAAFDFDLVEVPGNTRLNVFADAAGCSLDDIRELNPELLVPQTPPNSKIYELRIPSGTTAKFVESYDGIVRRDGAEHDLHTLRFGETLSDVAAIYEIPPRVLLVVNGLKARERVPYGTPLVVPKQGRGSYKDSENGITTLVVPASMTAVEGRVRRLYRVNSGDTLDALARASEVKPSDIVLWNFLDSRAILQTGMILQIFVPPPVDETRVSLIDPDKVKVVVAGTPEAAKVQRKKTSSGRRFYHKVRSGESLWTIARKYRVTVEDVKKWNRSIRRNNTLQPGQKLVVYPGKRKKRRK